MSDGVKPIFEKALDSSLDGIRAALLRTQQDPMTRFLEEVMGCYDIEFAEWRPDPAATGTLVRECRYSAPVPADVPDSIARVVGLPPVIGTTTVYRLRAAEPGELTLVQHTSAGDVLYGDRFKVQHTMSFKEDAGAIVSQQWVRVVWEQPLPWTHSMIRHFVEKRARAESIRVASQLLQILEDAVQAPEVEK